MLRAALALSVALSLPVSVQAQDNTLADIRQELSILLVEVQKLRRELSTTGTPGVDLSGTSALQRIDTMEAELRRLTGKTEELENRVNSVVTDGTNRIGDLQFRVCELEPGCDIGAIGETKPIGGEAAPVAVPAPADTPQGTELAIGEKQDFDRAREVLDQGDFRTAADLFATFTQTYTAGALTGEAHFYRGEALSQLGQREEAARAYLESFSGSPDGAKAPQALLKLGLMLNDLGQPADSCAILGEVTTRFPSSPASIEAQTARAGMTCG
ncbi:tol-pal system protein YbgF [Oceaniglobus trochenteri]|uniref:tol-pal system protein YbgF n=1 Tax=Oceaniglobus trochenteri TaxID=2763260 RepID=UPI001CFF8967|nr:tol-pal system protein YbgF [Oceaniglobus trochenteri]